MRRYRDNNHEEEKLTIMIGFMSQRLSSLESALDPILNDIPRLGNYMNVAKKNCVFPSKHHLTHDEAAAVFLYTMEWGKKSVYKMLNNALRTEDVKIIKPWWPYLKLFTNALLKLPVYNGNVWRGEGRTITNTFQEGQACVWWTMTSCSMTLDVMNDFIGDKGTLFLIDAKNARSIIGYSYHPQEEEVILLPGTTVHVLNNPFQDGSGTHMVSLKVFDEDKLSEDYDNMKLKSNSSNSNKGKCHIY
ncbi:unnamed protein product [Rotaria socialis]|uniref:NAD(P)(+)--arginine ADP-ribosyltransferase n=1 Tax=Rotaria socialis TaxID=392032 RepID=A0A821E0H1_9BILA|nr:unnamed protein product [Rotaria socialis]CAF4629410.1 unnamed protein product [Rotaria socialis]